MLSFGESSSLRGARSVPLALACLALGALLALGYDRRALWARQAHRLAAPIPFPTPRPDKWWNDVHDKYVREVQESEAEGGEPIGVIFYGDSLTESWNALDHGYPVARAAGVDKVFNASFGAYNARAFGIGSDEIAHLEWRLANGEIPTTVPPSIVVLNIGTNDLGAAREGTSVVDEQWAVMAAVPAITLRILAIVRNFRTVAPNADIVLQALYPRGSDPPHVYAQPSVYTAALRSINDHLHAFSTVDGKVHFSDCNERLRLPDESLGPDLIPDGVHPSPEGYARIAACLEISIRKLWDEGHRQPDAAIAAASPASDATNAAGDAAELDDSALANLLGEVSAASADSVRAIVAGSASAADLIGDAFQRAFEDLAAHVHG